MEKWHSNKPRAIDKLLLAMLKHIVLKLIALLARKKIYKAVNNPVQTQKSQLKNLIKTALTTKFGIDHNFEKIYDYESFKSQVPVREYEDIKNYIELIKQGEENILWPGRPIYFAITSGTTSGTKFIPITKDSLPNHLNGAKNAILIYVANTGKTKFIDGKFIFIQGSPLLTKTSGVPTGRLSGISAYHIPCYIKKNMLPTWKTNTIDDWENKLDSIINETINEDMTLISGIPSWLQMYFEKIKLTTGKKISSIFPNFNLLIYGGVNFKPYEKKFSSLIGKKIDTIELFPASEGFFAFQDQINSEGLLLILDSGIFYEFISVEDYRQDKIDRLSIEDIKINKDYLMIISTTAGLWGYNTGDTVRFVGLSPPRIIVTGRVKQQLSAFGEHVIVKEVEQAMQNAIQLSNALVSEFTVAPRFKSKNHNSCHEWYIEFDKEPNDLNEFALNLDSELQTQNKYYKDLILGNIIEKPNIKIVVKGGFKKYMKNVGKLGGQNKIPKIANDRLIVERIKKLNLVKIN